MAEKIISPGVFTQERDLSFLPQGVAQIGAVFVGPTIKGPILKPTQISSFNEFIQKFGPLTEKSYLPYAVQAYLKDAPNATIVRIAETSSTPAELDFGHFKLHTISEGLSANYELKAEVFSTRPTGSVPGSNFGDFSIRIRRQDTTDNNVASTYFGSNIQDTDSRPNIVEQFYNCSLDPQSPNFITKVIGDRYLTVDTSGTSARLKYNGDYPNKSSYVRVSITQATLDTLSQLTGSFNTYNIQSQYTASRNFSGATGGRGITGVLSGSSLNNANILTGESITAANTQGLDCSTKTATGSLLYKAAFEILSNQDEFDMNMIVTPGLIYGTHTEVNKFAMDLCEDRGDTFYVMDGGTLNGTVTNTVSNVKLLDTNYAATYYPWVKILDTDKNKPVWVPPSVVLPGVIAFNDQVAAEWYAPAGLNRGGLPNVVDVKIRLTNDERDELYTGRVNPIATFPSQGATVFGQKTLQARPSALDRINVRRLLIAVKKFIASSSRYLVFEQNTAATRNRFLSIVNPYLESIQQRNGLYAFRVVMDDTNNTIDMIDRNMLKGDIFLQPTKTAEFIVLDFTVLPTGAVFPE